MIRILSKPLIMPIHSTALAQPQAEPEQQAGGNQREEERECLDCPVRVDVIDSQVGQAELHAHERIHAEYSQHEVPDRIVEEPPSGQQRDDSPGTPAYDGPLALAIIMPWRSLFSS
jgi:hypothetical protein